MFENNPFLERKWRFGIPVPIWIKNEKMIGDMIRQNKLKPISGDYLIGDKPYIPAEIIQFGDMKNTKLKIRPIPFPGGMRYPHLHFHGAIYELNDKQWKEFSTKVVKDFQSKLAKVKTIGFEQVMEISEAVDIMG